MRRACRPRRLGRCRGFPRRGFGCPRHKRLGAFLPGRRYSERRWRRRLSRFPRRGSRPGRRPRRARERRARELSGRRVPQRCGSRLVSHGRHAAGRGLDRSGPRSPGLGLTLGRRLRACRFGLGQASLRRRCRGPSLDLRRRRGRGHVELLAGREPRLGGVIVCREPACLRRIELTRREPGIGGRGGRHGSGVILPLQLGRPPRAQVIVLPPAGGQRILPSGVCRSLARRSGGRNLRRMPDLGRMPELSGRPLERPAELSRPSLDRVAELSGRSLGRLTVFGSRRARQLAVIAVPVGRRAGGLARGVVPAQAAVRPEIGIPARPRPGGAPGCASALQLVGKSCAVAMFGLKAAALRPAAPRGSSSARVAPRSTARMCAGS
jgi:hypothetical protein